MWYKVTNISNVKIALEPPTSLKPGDSMVREYPEDNFPKRVVSFKKNKMIEIDPIPEKSREGKKLTKQLVTKVYRSPAATRAENLGQLVPEVPNQLTLKVPAREVVAEEAKFATEELTVKLKETKVPEPSTDMVEILKDRKVSISRADLEVELGKLKRPMLIKAGASVGVVGTLQYGKEDLIKRICDKVETVEPPTEIAKLDEI